MKNAQGPVVEVDLGRTPPTENGPFSTENDEKTENVRQVAAKVVEEVISRAAEAASQQRSDTDETRSRPVQALPTIQVDTVPSIPPSPEEDEEVVKPPLQDLQSAVTDELRDFMTSYVDDIVCRAVVRAEEELNSRSDEVRHVAEKVVEDIVSKAAEVVSEKQEAEEQLSSLCLETLPTFQIDTVPSMPPSPEEPPPEQQEPKKKDSKKEADESSGKDSEEARVVRTEKQDKETQEAPPVENKEEMVIKEQEPVPLEDPHVPEVKPRTKKGSKKKPKTSVTGDRQEATDVTCLEDVKLEEKAKIEETAHRTEVKPTETPKTVDLQPEARVDEKPKISEVSEPQEAVSGERLKKDATEVSPIQNDIKSDLVTEQVERKSAEVSAPQEVKSEEVKPQMQANGEAVKPLPEVKGEEVGQQPEAKTNEGTAQMDSKETPRKLVAQEEKPKTEVKTQQDVKPTSEEVGERPEVKPRMKKGPRKRKAEEEEAAKRAQEEEAAKRAQEEALKRTQEEEAAKREQEEAVKREQEEAKRTQEEATKRAQEEATKLAEEEAVKRAQEEAAAMKQEEEEKKKNVKAKEETTVKTMKDDTRTAKPAVDKGKIEVVADVVNSEESNKLETSADTQEVNRQQEAPSDVEAKGDVAKKRNSEDVPEKMMAPTVVIDSPSPKDESQGQIDFAPATDDELRDFAASYVNDIISKALSQAEEKRNYLVSQLGFGQGCSLTKSTRPWYIRAREAITDFIRVACFCGNRREDS